MANLRGVWELGYTFAKMDNKTFIRQLKEVEALFCAAHRLKPESTY
ncbi:hypothetical protein [Pontibacter ramchanderi]|uniref:Uncharacterized protein n=1 Tax=Pontibacter ramchanderi TaxID=1179743 RepID=A0A2N3V1B9_9BACT|nr:hypothetical protein [Pontibacter ramchanderi]PKV75420.1 hypothetical protein BD749_0362 [Pontibacter ramchanderi]